MEYWKPINNFEGLYEVSNMGRIKKTSGSILKPHIEKNGYVHIDLYKNKEKTRILVHRIVATAFIPRQDGCNVVNHKNCNPSDNRANNLEWCTQSYNVRYAYIVGRDNNVARKRIECVDTGETFCSSRFAAVWVNNTKYHGSKNIETISRTIRSAAHGDDGRTQAYGFHWSFR